MFWPIVLTLLILLVLYKVYKNVLLPYKIFSFYKTQFPQKNFRLFSYPFNPLGVEILTSSNKDEVAHGDAYYTAKYAGKDYDVILGNLTKQILLVLINPDLIKEFYQLDSTPVYIKQQEFITSLKRVARTAITFSEGEVWKNKRKFMTSFLNFGNLNKQYEKIAEITRKKIEEVAGGKGEFQIYMIQLLERITGATIIELFFGGEADELQIQGKKVSSYMREMIEHLGEQALDPVNFLIGQDFPEKNLRAKDRRVTHQVQKYKQFTKNFIRDRIYQIQQGNYHKQDYIKKIYDATPAQNRTPEFLTNIMYDFSSLYVAGTDTTSHSAMMVLYYIAKDDRVRTKLLEQINQYIKTDADITSQNVKQMIYLDCTVHECLRLYQPANGIFIRQATQDHNLGPIKILKGTLVMTSSITNHYNPQNFQNPTEFLPQRWLSDSNSSSSSKTLMTPKPYTWLTFSAGPRSCIGKHLALMEIKIITIEILRKFELKLGETQFQMRMRNFSYQPQIFMTKFVRK